MPHTSAINDILASLLLAYVPHLLCSCISPTGCQQNWPETNTSMHISRFLLLAFYYPPQSHCRASIAAAFSYLKVVITLWYRACAKENAKQLPKQFASSGAWKSLSLDWAACSEVMPSPLSCPVYLYLKTVMILSGE